MVVIFVFDHYLNRSNGPDEFEQLFYSRILEVTGPWIKLMLGILDPKKEK
jgi:hypothetical protein